MKEAVLLLAHGSRREEGNQQVKKIKDEVQAQDKDRRLYEAAFLQFGCPGLEEGVKKLVSLGVTKIIVVPLFLVAGNHVWKDIPQVIDELKQKHPGVKFIITGHLGASSKLSDVIADLIESGA